MICVNCGKAMKEKVGTYHYLESGLPNLYLEGIKTYVCSCGEEMAEIPCLEELNKKIARAIAEKSPRLNGPEIRFLRKHLQLKAVELARLLEVSKVTVSRWENDKVKIEKAYDAMIRAMIVSKDFKHVLKVLGSAQKTSRQHKYQIDRKTILACQS